MTLPGAETIKAGIIGLDCFLAISMRFLSSFFNVPLSFVRANPSLNSVTDPFEGDISRGRGEANGLEFDGVLIPLEELDRERVLLGLGSELAVDHKTLVIVERTSERR